MTDPCYEIVLYSVHDAEAADRARAEAHALAAALPGFLSWTGFTDPAAPRQRLDLVTWASLATAQAAAAVVGRDPAFAAFRASIASVQHMAHHGVAPAFPQPVLPGQGVEFGTFRLRPGVQEAQMRSAHAAMVRQRLSRQPGWRGQHLVRLDGGDYMDLAFAESRDRAEAICQGWAGRPECEAFLALIEAEVMRFGALA